MRFGLDIAQQRMPWTELVDRARFAEELGFDGVWGFDHFQPMYGDGPGECFEGNTTLAALSGHHRTRAPRPARHRHDLPPSRGVRGRGDHASTTRRTDGSSSSYGAAWFDKEHHRARHPVPATQERIDAFEEAVQIVRGLLTTDDFTFEGRHFQVHDATLRPRPVQQPHPPIWIGASGEKRMMPIAARYADVWHCFGPPEYVGPKSQRLERDGRSAPDAIPRAITRGRVALARRRPRHDRPPRSTRGTAAGFDYLVCGWPGRWSRADRAVRRPVPGDLTLGERQTRSSSSIRIALPRSTLYAIVVVEAGEHLLDVLLAVRPRRVGVRVVGLEADVVLADLFERVQPVVVGGEAAEDAAVVVGRRRVRDALLASAASCRAGPRPCRPARARRGSSRSGPREYASFSFGNSMSLPEKSQSASDAIELLNASVPPTPPGASGDAARVRRRRADVHAERDAGVVAHVEHRVPATAVDRRQLQVVRELAEAERAARPARRCAGSRPRRARRPTAA